MKILGVDTANRSCSVAIVDNGSTLAEQTLVSTQTHSKHLMEMVGAVVKLSSLALSEIDGFGVTIGPGTFTGLRIGISSVKGLAYATGKPVVGISSLDALAMQALFLPYLTAVFIDARKGEVYCARYRHSNSKKQQIRSIKETVEQVLPPEKAVSGINEPCIFIGSGAVLYKKIIEEKLNAPAYFAPDCLNMIQASTIANLALEKFQDSIFDDLNSLAPHYIRKSDAQIKNM